MVGRGLLVQRLLRRARSGGARVFIEDADPSRYVITSQALRRAGYDVGPFCGGRHFPEGRALGCPLVKRGRCALLEDADVIVYRFGLASPENLRMLEAMKRQYPRKPVVVEAAPSQLLEHRDLLRGYDVVVGPVATQSLLASVESALTGPRPR